MTGRNVYLKKCDVCKASWGDLEGHAGAYILYYPDNEEWFQGFRNEITNSPNTCHLNLLFFLRWLFQLLDMEQELQRKWAWQVFKISTVFYYKCYIYIFYSKHILTTVDTLF